MIAPDSRVYFGETKMRRRIILKGIIRRLAQGNNNKQKAVPPGSAPRRPESKSGMLLLHHGTIQSGALLNVLHRNKLNWLNLFRAVRKRSKSRSSLLLTAAGTEYAGCHNHNRILEHALIYFLTGSTFTGSCWVCTCCCCCWQDTRATAATAIIITVFIISLS